MRVGLLGCVCARAMLRKRPWLKFPTYTHTYLFKTLLVPWKTLPPSSHQKAWTQIEAVSSHLLSFLCTSSFVILVFQLHLLFITLLLARLLPSSSASSSSTTTTTILLLLFLAFSPSSSFFNLNCLKLYTLKIKCEIESLP